jgi:hypothetical protein
MNNRDSFILPSHSTLVEDAQAMLNWAADTMSRSRARAMHAAYCTLSKFAENTPGGRTFTRILDLAWHDYLSAQIGAPLQKRGSA